VLDLSPEKLFMLAALALVVLGPNRLPGAARSIGRVVGQLRAMSASLQTEVREALHDPEDEFTSALAEFRPGDVRRTVRRAVTDTLAPIDPGAVRQNIRDTLAAPETAPSVPARSVEPPGSVTAASEHRAVPDDPGLN
jgi:sec-independent protein translocase protein TatB